MVYYNLPALIVITYPDHMDNHQDSHYALGIPHEYMHIANKVIVIHSTKTSFPEFYCAKSRDGRTGSFVPTEKDIKEILETLI